MIRIVFSVLMIMIALPAMAEMPVRMITVYGNAKQEVAPDQALLQVTVMAQQQELADAKREHDQKLESLMRIAAEAQIAKKDLKTQHAHVNPHYRYQNGEQFLKGYQVSTMIQMKIRDLEKVGTLLQTLTNAGFDRIGNVQYVLGDVQTVRDEVMLEALKNAQKKAEKMAARLNQKIGAVLKISEGKSQHEFTQPMMRGGFAAGAVMETAAMDIAPPAGEMTINASVTVSYEIKE